jgi:hypothetical protein
MIHPLGRGGHRSLPFFRPGGCGGLSMNPGQWLIMLVFGVLLTSALGAWVILYR